MMNIEDELLVGDESDNEYSRYTKMMSILFHDIKKLDHKISYTAMDFKDSQRAHADGIKNVYDKLLILEKRQLAIEELLNSEHMKEMTKLIPNEQTIMKMFKMIDRHPISELKEHIGFIREELAELTDRFTF